MRISRLLPLLLTLVLLLSACGGGDSPEESASLPNSSAGDPAGPGTPDPEPEPEPVDLQAFYDATVGGYEFGSLQLAEGELLDGFYPGLSEIDTQQCLVYICRISINNGEFGLVQVSDAADVDAVKAIFQARIDYMAGDGEGPGGAWYPGPTLQWKDNSRVVSNGNYVMMIVHENCDDIVDAFNALF